MRTKEGTRHEASLMRTHMAVHGPYMTDEDLSRCGARLRELAVTHLFDPAKARELGVADAGACGSTHGYTMSEHELKRGGIDCPECLRAHAAKVGERT